MRPSAGSFPFPDSTGTVWLAYVDWGNLDNKRVLVCVHGLTRQGRDFDELAKAISRDFRVIEVDVVGRGRSGWLADKSQYNFDTYLRHMDALFAYRGLESVDFLGTSMGGIIGMLMAARKESPIRRLILNDVGPIIPKAGLQRIAQYVGDDPHFARLQEAADYLKHVHAGFGEISDLAWSEITMHSVTREPDQTYALHYDPAIGNAFRDKPIEEVDLWAVYDAIRCPTLVLRGAESDLLTSQTADDMRERGPEAEVFEFPGCGHAPSLMVPEQIEAVHEWLLHDPLRAAQASLDDEAGGDAAC
jgi:pimeloyl-ACP methyl ester carboxylesterase